MSIYQTVTRSNATVRRRWRRSSRGYRHGELVSLVAAGCIILATGCSGITGAQSDATATATDTAPQFQGVVRNRTYPLSSITCVLQLPEATGGNGAPVYNLTPMVPGWRFEGNSRTLTVSAATTGSWELTYRVEDSDTNTSSSDADTLTFTITVTEPEEEPLQPEEGISFRYQGCGNQVISLNADGEALDNTPYTIVLDVADADVYLIATNTTAGPATPSIERLDAIETSEEDPRPVPDREFLSGRVAPDSFEHGGPSISEFNNYSPPPSADSPLQQSRPDLARARQAVSEGDTYTYYDWYDVEQPDSHRVTAIALPATARRVVTDGAVTAVVWVANADWGNCSDCIRQEMVDDLADEFLRPGTDNDIYDWLTAAFGAPWGPHGSQFLIPAEYADEIHFLVYDIAGAGGFFSSANNRIRNPASSNISVRHSAERLLFYINAPSVVRRSEGSTDRTRSTTAHEFQHMIHHYQKRVRHDFRTESESWLNEMASMVAEDLVADKLMMKGPRGVDHDDPTAGEPTIRGGRLPRYNYYNHIQASTWKFESKYYAINYALGAYLARTYGGAPLFGDIVRNGQSGINAIVAALVQQGHSVSFEDVLTDWAVANLLSDDTRAEHPYRYNSGTWSTSDAGGVGFRLGSINLFNYRYHYGEGSNDYHDGPFLFSVAGFNEEGAQPPHSNRYADLGRNTGTVRLTIDADQGTRITVVVKG